MAWVEREPSLDSDVLQVRDVTLSALDHPATRREKLARIILDELYEFVGLLDAQGRILEINRAALEGAGIHLDAIAGLPFWDARWWAVSGESRDEAREMVERASKGEFVRRDVEVFGRAEGTQTIIVDYSLTPIRDRDGSVAFLLPEGRNITDKKLAEAELARRTEELQQLLDRVRELDGARSNFYANVSHELRTPLTLILGPTEELLRDEDLRESQRQQLDVIRRNALMLLKQVNALLDLAKIDAGEMDLNYVRFDVGQLVRMTAAHFDALAQQRGITYIVEAPTGVTAELDPDKYERIVVNLVSNAFKHTPDQGWIRCRVEVSKGQRVLLSVQDSGPGVDPSVRSEIFDRFHTARAANSQSTGTGLGLAIVKQFAELHGGTATLLDAPFGGALFQVEVPRSAPVAAYVRVADVVTISQTPSADEHARAEPAHPSVEVVERTRPSPTVMVVEDHPDMRRFVVEALRDEWRVVATSRAEAALEVLDDHLPDLVITDLMLPGMSGEELCQRIRNDHRTAQVPVIVLSARADDSLRLQLLTNSVQDYVTKPFSAQELRARVRNLVTTKRARDALQSELDTQTGDLTTLTHQLITGRRALQASHDAVRHSEARWRAVYENSAAGIALVDPKGTIVDANPALAAMLGWHTEDLCGSRLVEHCAAEDRARFDADLVHLTGTGDGVSRVQGRLLGRGGRLVWVEASLAITPPLDDGDVMVVCVIEDVTERIEARAALARAYDELTRVSRVSALGTLAGSIAHEVNQPLAAISANAHACLRWLSGAHRDEAEAIAAAERIARDAERAGDVVAGVRRFVGRGAPARTVVDVGHVVDDVMELLGPLLAAEGAVVERHGDGAGALIEADRVQIQQVLVNLVTNGLEAMRDPSPSEMVIGITTTTGPQTVQVRVTDRGPGIDEDVRARMFDPFFSTKGDGMGIGLAISRSIVESHGGTVEVESTGPDGTCIVLTLPLADRTDR